jgi:fatty-acyl-CoA synthase
MDYATARLAKFQKPKGVVVADSLPKTPIGKVLKRELRRQYGQ